MIQFRALGALTVTDRAGDGISVGGPRQRRLLAALLIHRNEVVSTDRLAEAVFAGEPTPAASTTLRSYVARIRKVLTAADGDSATTLVTRAPGYLLRVPDESFDVARFEQLLTEASNRLEGDDPTGASTAAREALSLWRGDAYAEFADEPWAMPEAQRLAELRLVTHERHIEAELACGHAAEMIPLAGALADEHELREAFRAQLMLALYRTGRHTDALQVFRDYRDLLVEELGVDPTPTLTELERRILAHDPTLTLDDPAGRRLRGYRLGERIGTGRDGTVYAARLPGVERDTVIRVVRQEIADRPEFVRSFESTAHQVASLHHPAVVPIHDYWREPGAAHLVMRRMYGGSLADRLARGSIPHSEVANLVERIGGALVAAAERGIVHGRVAPESILYDENGVPHLGDFALGAQGPPRTTGDDVHDLAVLVTRCLSPDEKPRQAVAEALASATASVNPPAMADFVPRLVAALTGARDAETERANPYKGLRAFDEADAADFFGREDVVAAILDRLARDDLTGRLILVVGGSGTGKSSVVRAGLLPRVRRGDVLGSQEWFVTSMLPGSSPFKELAEGLRRVSVTDTTGLADELALDGGVDRVLRRLVPAGGQLLLVVDQFEELFTLATAEDRRAFLAGVLQAVTAEDSRLRVVATLRADFYDRPLTAQGFGTVVTAATVPIPAMSPAELEEAIVEPVARVGGRVEPALVAEMVSAVAAQPAALPSLQFTLYELAERCPDRTLTLAAYRELGGVDGAIAARAEALYVALDDSERTAVRRMFERLVVVHADGEPTRRAASRTELSAGSLIDRWAQARLLTLDRNPETRVPTVEVAHEAMLREWPRLRNWIAEDCEKIVVLGQLREAARSWDGLDREKEALYRGARLQVGLDVTSGRDDVSDLEREFLEASVRERDREQQELAERSAEQARTNRRLRLQLTAIAAALVVAVVGGVVALDQRQQAQGERRDALARELSAASVASLEDDPERSILLALAAVDQTRSYDGTVLQQAEDALHRAVTTSRVLLSVPGVGGSVDWSPDGETFVTEGPEDSGIIDIRSTDTGESVRSWPGHDIDINSVAFSADGSRLATSGDDGAVRVWDPRTGDLIHEYRDGRGGIVFSVSLSPDGSQAIASWLDQEAVRVIDLTAAEVVTEITGVTTKGIAFSPDGTRIAYGGVDGVAQGKPPSNGNPAAAVADAGTGETLFTVRADVQVDDLAWSPDGRWLATSDRDGSVDLWSGHTGKPRHSIDAHRVEVIDLDWDRDSARLATASSDGTARVWEVTETGARQEVSLAAQGSIQGGMWGVSFSPDGERLLSGDTAVSMAKIWDVGAVAGAERLNIAKPPGEGAARFIKQRQEIVAITRDALRFWDADSGEEVRTLQPEDLKGTDGAVPAIVNVSPDGELAVTVDPVRVWDVGTGEQVFAHAEAVPSTAGAWSGDGRLHATAWIDQEAGLPRVTVVDRVGQELGSLAGEAGFVFTTTVFSPNGRLLATTRDGLDRTAPDNLAVQIWDWRRGTLVRTIETPAGHVVFAPSGKRLVTRNFIEGIAQVWDVETGEHVATFAGHAGGVESFSVSPDSSRVATVGADSTVRIWDLETGVERLTLTPEFAPREVDFSPDGSRLVTFSFEGLIRVWALDLDELIQIATERLTRGLTAEECRQYLHRNRCPPSGSAA